MTVTGSDYPATTVDLAEVSDDGDGNEITTGAPQLTPTNITVADIVDGEFTSELTINGESLGSPYTVTVTSTQAGDIITATFTVAAAPEPAPYTLSTDVATEGVRIQLSGTATTPVPAGEDLTVTLKKWGLPSSIPTSSVLILGTTSNMSEPYSGEPAEVRIEAGNKILLSLTSRYENGEAAGPLLAGQDYSVVFKKSAGITNPILAGDKYAMQLADLDPGSHSYGSIQIKSKVKLVPATNAGPRGTALEITGLGLNSGDATIFLNSETRSGRVVATAYRLDKAYASGGIAKVTVDTTTQTSFPARV